MELGVIFILKYYRFPPFDIGGNLYLTILHVSKSSGLFF